VLREGFIEDVIMIFSTVSSKGEAEKIARALIGKRVAACVSMFGPIKSMYWWDGKIEESEEYLLIIKTTRSKYGELEGIISKIHSYQVPEILAIPIVSALKEYIEWLREELEE